MIKAEIRTREVARIRFSQRRRRTPRSSGPGEWQSSRCMTLRAAPASGPGKPAAARRPTAGQADWPALPAAGQADGRRHSAVPATPPALPGHRCGASRAAAASIRLRVARSKVPHPPRSAKMDGWSWFGSASIVSAQHVRARRVELATKFSTDSAQAAGLLPERDQREKRSSRPQADVPWPGARNRSCATWRRRCGWRGSMRGTTRRPTFIGKDDECAPRIRGGAALWRRRGVRSSAEGVSESGELSGFSSRGFGCGGNVSAQVGPHAAGRAPAPPRILEERPGLPRTRIKGGLELKVART
jgi:hypothetical protein